MLCHSSADPLSCLQVDAWPWWSWLEAGNELVSKSDIHPELTTAGPGVSNEQKFRLERETHKEYNYICNRKIEASRVNGREYEDSGQVIIIAEVPDFLVLLGKIVFAV